MTRLLLASAALLALSACTLGPDYQVPDAAKVNLPEVQGGFQGIGAQSAEPLPARWWRLYDDSRLDRLEEEALAANTDLRQAAANIARARAAEREVDGYRDPHGAVEVGTERAALSGESYLLPVPIPAAWLQDSEVKVAYQLDLFGRLKRAAEAAKADREASEAGLDLARVSIAAEVARAFVETCASGHELAVAQKLVDVTVRQRDVTAKLSGAGRLSTIEVTRAKAQADQARAALPPLETRRRAALYRLAVLTGKPPADFPADLASCAEEPRLTRPIPVGDGAALLRRRPDIRQAERGLAAATARIGVATAALYPDITLGASAGTIGKIADFAQPATNTWAFGSLISWTFPGASEHARVQGADAASAAALARFDGVVLNALRETETSLIAYSHDLERNAALRASRDDAAESADEAERLYRSGRTPILTGLSAQQSLAGAEQALAASEAQLSLDQVALFLALGGGWTE